MELSELEVFPRLQEDTHDDINMRLTGDGVLTLELENGSIRIVVENGTPTIDKVVNTGTG